MAIVYKPGSMKFPPDLLNCLLIWLCWLFRLDRWSWESPSVFGVVKSPCYMSDPGVTWNPIGCISCPVLLSIAEDKRMSKFSQGHGRVRTRIFWGQWPSVWQICSLLMVAQCAQIPKWIKCLFASQWQKSPPFCFLFDGFPDLMQSCSTCSESHVTWKRNISATSLSYTDMANHFLMFFRRARDWHFIRNICFFKQFEANWKHFRGDLRALKALICLNQSFSPPFRAIRWILRFYATQKKSCCQLPCGKNIMKPWMNYGAFLFFIGRPMATIIQLYPVHPLHPVPDGIFPHRKTIQLGYPPWKPS